MMKNENIIEIYNKEIEMPGKRRKAESKKDYRKYLRAYFEEEVPYIGSEKFRLGYNIVREYAIRKMEKEAKKYYKTHNYEYKITDSDDQQDEVVFDNLDIVEDTEKDELLAEILADLQTENEDENSKNKNKNSKKKIGGFFKNIWPFGKKKKQVLGNLEENITDEELLEEINNYEVVNITDEELEEIKNYEEIDEENDKSYELLERLENLKFELEYAQNQLNQEQSQFMNTQRNFVQLQTKFQEEQNRFEEERKAFVEQQIELQKKQQLEEERKAFEEQQRQIRLQEEQERLQRERQEIEEQKTKLLEERKQLEEERKLLEEEKTESKVKICETGLERLRNATLRLKRESFKENYNPNHILIKHAYDEAVKENEIRRFNAIITEVNKVVFVEPYANSGVKCMYQGLNIAPSVDLNNISYLNENQKIEFLRNYEESKTKQENGEVLQKTR